jgi:N-methylhydantoinase A
MNAIEAALGIIKIANNNMSRILRIVTVERGLDPREFTLLAFGGAGPLHACSLAEELDIKEILVPRSPGLFSTMGLLHTDVKHTYVKSIRKQIPEIDFKELEHHYQELETRGNDVLKEEGFEEKSILYQRLIDARYISQGFELLIPISDLSLNDNNIVEKLIDLFNEKHQSIYGYKMEDEEVEIVNIRSNCLGIIEKSGLSRIQKGTKNPIKESLVETREVYFDGENSSVDTSIYSRDLLLSLNEINGPAIIEQYDTTTIIPPKWRAKIDEFGLIHLQRK